jgi:hypothetical protein
MSVLTRIRAGPLLPGGGGGPQRPTRGERRASVRGLNTTEVREWARAQGIEVKDRGRVPAELVARFKAAERSRPGTFQAGQGYGTSPTCRNECVACTHAYRKRNWLSRSFSTAEVSLAALLVSQIA